MVKRRFERQAGWEIPRTRTASLPSPAALLSASRSALPSSRGGSRDRAAPGSCHPLLRRPGDPAARQIRHQEFIRSDERDRRPRGHDDTDDAVTQAMGDVRGERCNNAQAEQPARAPAHPAAPSSASPSNPRRSDRPPSTGSGARSSRTRRGPVPEAGRVKPPSCTVWRARWPPGGRFRPGTTSITSAIVAAGTSTYRAHSPGSRPGGGQPGPSRASGGTARGYARAT